MNVTRRWYVLVPSGPNDRRWKYMLPVLEQSFLLVNEHFDESTFSCTRLTNKRDKFWVSDLMLALTVTYDSGITSVVLEDWLVTAVPCYPKPSSIFIINV